MKCFSSCKDSSKGEKRAKRRGEIFPVFRHFCAQSFQEERGGGERRGTFLGRFFLAWASENSLVWNTFNDEEEEEGKERLSIICI